jgi:hypothetical protein
MLGLWLAAVLIPWQFDLEYVALMTLIVAVMSPLVIWSWWRGKFGSAFLDSAGIVVRTRTDTVLYPWSDVVAVAVANEAAFDRITRLLYRLYWVDGKTPFAQVKLKRMLRRHPWRSRMSTRGFGIPTFARTAGIYVADVDGFVSAANRYLHQNESTTPDGAWDKFAGIDDSSVE